MTQSPKENKPNEMATAEVVSFPLAGLPLVKTAELLMARCPGAKFFLLTGGTKIPLPGSRGLHDATADLDSISDDVLLNDCGMAWVPGGLTEFALDVDIKGTHKGATGLCRALGMTVPEGLTEVAAIDRLVDRFDTLIIKSPSGGIHIVLRHGLDHHVAWPNRPEGIDFRAGTGYLVLPNTVLPEGSYTVIKDRPLAMAPAELIAALCKADDPATADLSKLTTDWHPDMDSDDMNEAATEYLKARAPAVQGSRGDHETHLTARWLYDKGLSPDMALELMEEHFNPRCSPPWDSFDLAVKVGSAYATSIRQGKVHGGRPAASADSFGKSSISDFPVGFFGDDHPGKSPAAAPDSEKSAKHSPYAGMASAKDMVAGIIARRITLDDLNPVNLAGMEYCYGQSYSYGLVSVIAAPGGMGKSTLLILRAILAAVGLKYIKARMEAPGDHVDRLKALLEAGEKPDDDAMGVWLWNLEDSRDNILLRVFAACTFYGIEPAVVIKSLLVNGREDRLAVAKMDESNTVRIYVPALEKVSEVIHEHGVKMLLAEPFVKTIEVNDENNNTAMSTAVEAWAKLADVEGIAVGLAHNSVKWDGKDIEVYKRNAMRGAGAIRDHVRVAEVLVPMNDREKDSSVTKDDWKRFFYIHADKENFGPNNRARFWFTFDSVEAPAHKDSRKGLPRSVGVITVASVNEDITSYSRDQVTTMLAAIKEHTPPGKDEKDTDRYKEFAEGSITGPLCDLSASSRHVDRFFAPILNMKALLDSTDPKERDKASRAVATAVRVLLANDLIERRNDIYSPRQANRGGKREVDGFLLTAMGQRKLLNGLKQAEMDKELALEAVEANTPNPGQEEDFG
ncbi:AAA family ATPase [Aestuariivirga sp.]|uniref:AAA family ATPase n=1 Tax=Aestuariivirga sp. TaxID=2650926 RepID=UPI00359413B8